MSDLNFTFPVNELAFAIAEQLKQLWMAQQPQKKEPAIPPHEEKYLTRKEAAKKLKVSLPTLHDYTKRGIIKGFRFGSQVRYLESDIMAALTQMNYN